MPIIEKKKKKWSKLNENIYEMEPKLDYKPVDKIIPVVWFVGILKA
jgi:beta-lactamase regulating signal transducer with metallopeptidase domain